MFAGKQYRIKNKLITQLIKEIIVINRGDAAMCREKSNIDYVSLFSFQKRFRFIKNLSKKEMSQYAQIVNSKSIRLLREKLQGVIDTNLRSRLDFIFDEWVNYGISICESNTTEHWRFKSFYDEIMEKHSIKKDSYRKVDFSARKINNLIIDERFLNEKLSALQIFKAAYQLGEIPGLSNLRFMYNSAIKNDGKYREWMFHFDNSNYAPEFKIITTRAAGTSFSNSEQCLAAFPYDTRETIRFTECEAATKFSTMRELENEFCGVPGASYAVIKGQPNGVPLEVGLRTEMILHHRSAPGYNDYGECRDSELLTFHGIERCQPFLTKEELNSTSILTPLQKFVLGGFKYQAADVFFEAIYKQRGEINQQLRDFLSKGMCRHLADFIVAEFPSTGVKILQGDIFKEQKSTYENLTKNVIEIPRLTNKISFRRDLYHIIPRLMNLDQNVVFRPDCSENLIFPARTQLRERTNFEFMKPVFVDIPHIIFSTDSDFLIPLVQLTKISSTIEEIYHKLSKKHIDKDLATLFRSRAALACDYSLQLVNRVYTAESHQTIILFIYYMLHDLEDFLTERSFESAPPHRLD